MCLWKEYKDNGYDSDELLIHLCIDSTPIDLFNITKLLGISVQEVGFVSKEQSGSLHWDKNNQPIIHINKLHSLRQQKFAIAHELGHLFNDRVGKSADINGKRGSYIVETRANVFAVNLIMPRHLIEGACMTYSRNIKVLSEVFDVSEKSILLRLKVLGL
jgi:Zn-dependent peptidase ImmA (M78 family)